MQSWLKFISQTSHESYYSPKCFILLFLPEHTMVKMSVLWCCAMQINLRRKKRPYRFSKKVYISKSIPSLAHPPPPPPHAPPSSPPSADCHEHGISLFKIIDVSLCITVCQYADWLYLCCCFDVLQCDCFEQQRRFTNGGHVLWQKAQTL